MDIVDCISRSTLNVDILFNFFGYNAKRYII